MAPYTALSASTSVAKFSSTRPNNAEKCLTAASTSSSPFVVARTWPPSTPPRTAEITSIRTRQKIARDGRNLIESSPLVKTSQSIIAEAPVNCSGLRRWIKSKISEDPPSPSGRGAGSGLQIRIEASPYRARASARPSPARQPREARARQGEASINGCRAVLVPEGEGTLFNLSIPSTTVTVQPADRPTVSDGPTGANVGNKVTPAAFD